MIKEFRILALCTVGVALCSLSAGAQQTPTQPQVLSNAVANEPIQFDTSRPLAQLLAEAPTQQFVHQTHAPRKTKNLSPTARLSTEAAGALEPLIGPLIGATTNLSFRCSWDFQAQ